MTVYSELFSAGTVTSGSPGIYTVPTDGFTYVLRDIVLAQLSTGTAECVLGNAASELIDSVASSGQYAVHHNDLRQVLIPGEVLILSVLSGSWSYRLTGYKLS